VDAGNAVLLPESKRTFTVPYAPVDGKGFPGQSNVWYPKSTKPSVTKFIARLRRYVASPAVSPKSNASDKRRRRGWPMSPDKSLMLEIESRAVAATVKHFEDIKYAVERVEKDCCGWDLTATKGKRVLQLEVKGHLGNVIQFELTPNEFDKMRTLYPTYRVCVLRQALERQVVEIYVPKKTKRGLWLLTSTSDGTIVALEPRIAARASEIR
jgi:hypothetical protein